MDKIRVFDMHVCEKLTSSFDRRADADAAGAGAADAAAASAVSAAASAAGGSFIA